MPLGIPSLNFKMYLHGFHAADEIILETSKEVAGMASLML
jgi:hypothetical protein